MGATRYHWVIFYQTTKDKDSSSARRLWLSSGVPLKVDAFRLVFQKESVFPSLPGHPTMTTPMTSITGTTAEATRLHPLAPRVAPKVIKSLTHRPKRGWPFAKKKVRTLQCQRGGHRLHRICRPVSRLSAFHSSCPMASCCNLRTTRGQAIIRVLSS